MDPKVNRSKIFKICSQSDWKHACEEGIFAGAPVDLKDGFIHFSARHQVEGTLAKHFAGVQDLLLIQFPADAFGEALKWEVSRGGDEFPHLYGELPTDTAETVFALSLDDEGKHRLPNI